MAKRRLLSLKKKFLKGSSLKQRYAEVIDTYLAKGYAKQMPTEALVSEKIKQKLNRRLIVQPKIMTFL